MYGLGPQQFLKQAAANKPGDTSQIQRGKEPGPANHPNTAEDQAEMNKASNQDMENNKDLDIKNAKPGTPVTGPTPEMSSSDLEIPNKVEDTDTKVSTGFFDQLKAKLIAYGMEKGEAKMAAMMDPKGDQSEGGKDANFATDEAPKENRPGVDKPERPTRNDPKGNVPKTPKGPVSNTPPAPKIPKMAKLKMPNIPKLRL